MGPYYSTGFKPTSLFADSKNVRAWPGGAGYAKLGGNYAPTIKHLVCCKFLQILEKDSIYLYIIFINISFFHIYRVMYQKKDIHKFFGYLVMVK